MYKLPRDYQVALMMALTAMFTLAGYELVRSSATVLFKNAYGAENLPLVMAAMPFVVFAGVALYGWILSRFGPRRTLIITSTGSALLIIACYLGVLAGSRAVTPILFLTKEFYVVLLIEQYWSYINSSLQEKNARVVNGPITGVAGIGSVIGGWTVAQLALPLGTENLLLLAALALLPAVLLANFTYRRFGEPEPPPREDKTPVAVGMGWNVLARNPTLSGLLVVVLATQVIAAVLDFRFQGLLSDHFGARQDDETAFQGQFWFLLNSTAVASQFILTPLLLVFVRLRLVHLLMPLVHCIAIGYAILDPTIWSVGAAFFMFKVFDYSLFRGAKELLYIPLGFDERYRVKEIIDVFGYRSGKGVSSLAIVALQRAGVAMANYYLFIAMIATVLWLALVFPLTRPPAASTESN